MNAPRIDFASSPRPTLGVEWEIALVDKSTRDLVNSAEAVMDGVRDLAGDTPRVTKELLRNTVELVTGVCENVGEAM